MKANNTEPASALAGAPSAFQADGTFRQAQGTDEGGTGSPTDFISDFIKQDLENGRFNHVLTRFPPEPNGWLHIGHLKAINIDFSMAAKFGGKCNLRFDDTNPEKEDVSYVEAIKRDVRWLGYEWEDREFYASDYYDYLYELAIKIIRKGHAYVDDLSEDEIREYRGTAVPDKHNITLTPPGKNSPWRERSIEENLDLFARMRAGEFADGAKTLRAKIDMAHPNLVMRDPVMYRIRRERHYRTGSAWCIYPMYDFQHPLSDAKEGITHSLCSLEYEIHRPLYEWFIAEAEVFPSRQIEFARLNLSYTVLSKRYLLQLVTEKRVCGWDDPRMPTVAGLRRRGYTPEALRDFMGRIGVAKTDSMVDFALLEYCLREDLNKRAFRVMAVLRPLKLIIENWDEGKVEELDAVNNPEDASYGTRKIKFTRELWIEREDFAETPPPKYFRLFPGNSVRLRYGYIVTCTGFDKDAQGAITAVRCTYDPQTRGGNAPDNRRVKGTIHWVSCAAALPIEARIYTHLFAVERPMESPPGGTFLDNLSPDSVEVLEGYLEDSGQGTGGSQGIGDRGQGTGGSQGIGDRGQWTVGSRRETSTNADNTGTTDISNAKTTPYPLLPTPYIYFQFERQGYFVRDPDTGRDGRAVFNKTVGLRDTWAKMQKK